MFDAFIILGSRTMKSNRAWGLAPLKSGERDLFLYIYYDCCCCSTYTSSTWRKLVTKPVSWSTSWTRSIVCNFSFTAINWMSTLCDVDGPRGLVKKSWERVAKTHHTHAFEYYLNRTLFSRQMMSASCVSFSKYCFRNSKYHPVSQPDLSLQTSRHTVPASSM